MYDGNKQLELTKENNIENNIENNNANNKENNKENVIENNEEKKINNEFNLINQKLIKYITKLKYIGKEKLSLLKMVVDELGFYSLINNNDFTPSLDMYYSDKELVISIECPEGAKLTVKRRRNKNKFHEYPFCIEIIEEKVDQPKQENVTYIRNKQIGKYQNLIHFPDYNDASY